MSVTAVIVSIYLAIGLLAMTVMIARGKKGYRTDITPMGVDDPIGAGLCLLMLLFWPLWFLMEIKKGKD